MTSTAVDRINGARSSLAIKAPVKSASTANLTLSGTQTVDGVALITGDRVLVKNQTSSINNGIYVVDTGTWNRSPDADGNADWTRGTLVQVTDGSTTSGFWYMSTTGTIIVGTTSIAFAAASVGLAIVSAYMQTVLAAADATTAYALLAAAGLSMPGDISPGALVANTDNWAPAGFATASTVRVSATVAINLTGIAAGTDGRAINLHNVGAFAITLKDAATSVAANQFQLNGDYVLNADASVALQYDATSSKWRLFGQQGTQASVSFNRLMNNVGLTVTMAASAATIALTDAIGTIPTASSPCTINVRDGTLANGKVNQRTVQAALSTVISAGSTGGTVSAVQSRIYVAATDVGGTIELAWINATVFPDENTLITTTAEGGAGAADTLNTWYSTTARASVAFTLVGYFESTQATAGTWATAPSKITINPQPYPAAQGASWVLLATQTASAVATVDFTANNGGLGFDDTFDRYMISFENVKPATDDVYLALRIGTGATPTWQAGAASYVWTVMNSGPGGAGAGDGSTTIGTLIGMGGVSAGLGVGNAAGEHISGVIEYTNPETASDYVIFNFRNAGARSDEKAFQNAGGGYWNTVGAITGIRFLFSSGNITSGTFRLYGLRKS